MENFSRVSEEDEQIELPPGFRFHPTDEELITHYLTKKVLDSCFSAIAIGEVDLNKVEPWDLPWRAKMGEKQWYFFCVRDRKYPTGLRTNRATDAGYWKATGKDKEIFKKKALVGMKKTLVFYKGRAPKGEKTNWVMHEFRLEGKYSVYDLQKTVKSEWVICRVFQKRSDGKKVHISDLGRLGSQVNQFHHPSVLPPLMDSSSPYNGKPVGISSYDYESCFSDQIIEDENRLSSPEYGLNRTVLGKIQPGSEKSQLDLKEDFNPLLFGSSSSSSTLQSVTSFPSLAQLIPNTNSLLYSDSVLLQDNSILKMLLESQETETKQNDPKTEISWSGDSVVSAGELIRRPFNDHGGSTGPVNIDCLWNY